jgi:hypothetical protein
MTNVTSIIHAIFYTYQPVPHSRKRSKTYLAAHHFFAAIAEMFIYYNFITEPK